ncbi:MAG: hypothetical protein Q3X94_04560, partial [Oscillospiraceae bacterium]|nr:hypothetical protein [Oscillospiraceae bacterium]
AEHRTQGYILPKDAANVHWDFTQKRPPFFPGHFSAAHSPPFWAAEEGNMPEDMHEFILKRRPLFWQPVPGGIGLFCNSGTNQARGCHK